MTHSSSHLASVPAASVAVRDDDRASEAHHLRSACNRTPGRAIRRRGGRATRPKQAAIAPVRYCWRRAGRSGLPGRCAWAPASPCVPLSECSTPDGAGEAAARVLATRESVANGGGWPRGRRRHGAASPGRTGSRGRVGRLGWWRSEARAGAGLNRRSVASAPQQSDSTSWGRAGQLGLVRREQPALVVDPLPKRHESATLTCFSLVTTARLMAKVAGLSLASRQSPVASSVDDRVARCFGHELVERAPVDVQRLGASGAADLRLVGGA